MSGKYARGTIEDPFRGPPDQRHARHRRSAVANDHVVVGGHRDHFRQVGRRIGAVGIEDRDERGCADRDSGLQRSAVAAVVGHVDHRCTGRLGPLQSIVPGTVVDDDDLVRNAGAVQLRADGFHRRSDRPFLIVGRDDDGHGRLHAWVLGQDP